MSRRRYIGLPSSLPPIGVNDLNTWTSRNEDTLLNIAYRDNKSDIVLERVIGNSDCLYKEIQVKPNKLYKLVFSYEVKESYEIRDKSSWFGLGVFKDLQEAFSGVRGNRTGAEAYMPFGFTPEKNTAVLYFIPKTESIILYLGLRQVKDKGAHFIIGDIAMSEGEAPSITEGEVLGDVRILTSGVGGVLDVVHTDGRKEGIPLPAGLNSISLPSEVRKISFAGERGGDKKNSILFADLGNIRVQDTSELFTSCARLYMCGGVNLSAGTSLYSTFAYCESLESIIGALDFRSIGVTTWVSFLCKELTSLRIQNLGASSRELDLRACGNLSVKSVEYMVSNSLVPTNATCKVVLNEKAFNRVSEELKQKANDRRVILDKK